MAILDAGLTCSASLPCPAEMGGSIHIHGTGSSIVDTIFVCRDGGIMSRAWLFEDATQLAQIMTRELADLRTAGMKPTVGDIRCIAYGHLTRMAIWNLRPLWDTSYPTKTKLTTIRVAMDAISTVADILAHLEGASVAQPIIDNGLFAQQAHMEQLDAITF